MAKIRLGSLELRIETGRFSRPILEEYQRTCLVCVDMNEHTVENETHFLLYCSLYQNLRDAWLTKLILPLDFHSLVDSEKLKYVFNDPVNVKMTSQFIIDAYNLGSKKLNSPL